MKEEFKFLKYRGDDFYKYALLAIKDKKYHISALHFEQSAQLYLKYTLALLLGDFPKTHSLNKLLNLVIKSIKDKKISKNLEKFEEKWKEIIFDLEEAYFTSRYFPVEFSKDKVLKMKNFLRELKENLKILWS
ncbi:MAG: HEPN domain-containing protein [Minisyncoccia bacterium]